MTSTNPLVSVPELAAAHDGPHRPTAVDVRWSLAGPSGVEAYWAGHQPRAGYADLDHDLRAFHPFVTVAGTGGVRS